MISIDSLINDNYEMSLNVFCWIFTFATIQSNYLMYLGFVMNQKLYINNCKPCHLLMKKYCTKLAESKVTEIKELDPTCNETT